MKIKLNYKSFIKDYNLYLAKIKQIEQTTEINRGDISQIRLHNEVISNKEFLKIKDNIILLE